MLLFAAAGALHVLVDGKHVIPGGHRLALTNPERCQLAFAAPDVQCRAGEQHCALVRLLDSKGFQLQVSFTLYIAAPCLEFLHLIEKSDMRHHSLAHSEPLI